MLRNSYSPTPVRYIEWSRSFELTVSMQKTPPFCCLSVCLCHSWAALTSSVWIPRMLDFGSDVLWIGVLGLNSEKFPANLFKNNKTKPKQTRWNQEQTAPKKSLNMSHYLKANKLRKNPQFYQNLLKVRDSFWKIMYLWFFFIVHVPSTFLYTGFILPLKFYFELHTLKVPSVNVIFMTEYQN